MTFTVQIFKTIWHYVLNKPPIPNRRTSAYTQRISIEVSRCKQNLSCLGNDHLKHEENAKCIRVKIHAQDLQSLNKIWQDVLNKPPISRRRTSAYTHRIEPMEGRNLVCSSQNHQARTRGTLPLPYPEEDSAGCGASDAACELPAEAVGLSGCNIRYHNEKLESVDDFNQNRSHCINFDGLRSTSIKLTNSSFSLW